MARICTVVRAALTAWCVITVATPSSAQDPAGAELLFQEGRRLLAEGNVDAACEKLKESYALDPMSGTLLNVADCHVRQGKTATAWARFRNAAELAKSQGKIEQAGEATRRANELEPDLSYLTIEVKQPVPGLEVKRGDVAVGPGLFGVAVPVDPGHYDVVASAPGYHSFKQSAQVGDKRDRQTVTIPVLASAGGATPREESAAQPPANATSKSPTKPPSASGGSSPWPWVVAGAGTFALVTGGVFGVLALGSNQDADKSCPTHQNCSPEALSAADRRDLQATVANVGIGLGVVGVGVAVWMLASSGARAGSTHGSSAALQTVVQRREAPRWAYERF